LEIVGYFWLNSARVLKYDKLAARTVSTGGHLGFAHGALVPSRESCADQIVTAFATAIIDNHRSN
jgi:hypothetical protein